MNNANSWPKCLWMCFSPPYYQCRTIFRPDKLAEFLGSVMKFKTAAVCNPNVKTVIKWSVSKSCFLHLVLPWALIQGRKQRFTWIRFACFWASKWDRQAVRGTLDFAYFCLMTGQLLDSSSSGGTARRGRAWCGISDISCVCIRDGGVVLRVTHTDARRWWLSQQGWYVFLFSLQGGSSRLLC